MTRKIPVVATILVALAVAPALLDVVLTPFNLKLGFPISLKAVARSLRSSNNTSQQCL